MYIYMYIRPYMLDQNGSMRLISVNEKMTMLNPVCTVVTSILVDHLSTIYSMTQPDKDNVTPL